MSEQFQPPDQPPNQSPYGSPPPFTSPKEGSAWAGFGLSLLLHLLQLPLAGILALLDQGAYIFLILFIGVSQLLYIIPAIIIAVIKGKPHIVKGLIIGAALVFLLNAACTGIVFFSLSQGSFH